MKFVTKIKWNMFYEKNDEILVNQAHVWNFVEFDTAKLISFEKKFQKLNFSKGRWSVTRA